MKLLHQVELMVEMNRDKSSRTIPTNQQESFIAKLMESRAMKPSNARLSLHINDPMQPDIMIGNRKRRMATCLKLRDHCKKIVYT